MSPNHTKPRDQHTRYVPITNVELEAAQDLPIPDSMLMVSSLHVDRRGGHDHCKLYNRGGLAGDLVLIAGDGAALAARLGLVDEARVGWSCSACGCTAYHMRVVGARPVERVCDACDTPHAAR